MNKTHRKVLNVLQSCNGQDMPARQVLEEACQRCRWTHEEPPTLGQVKHALGRLASTGVITRSRSSSRAPYTYQRREVARKVESTGMKMLKITGSAIAAIGTGITIISVGLVGDIFNDFYWGNDDKS